MPKLEEQPICSEQIDRFLATEDDFTFELVCLRILKQQQLCMRIHHAGSYSDPVTNTNRQFDFRVLFSDLGFDVSLAIECKHLKTHFPLVISRVPRRESEAFHEILVPTDNTLGAGLHTSQTFRYNIAQSVYAVGELTGKSTAQVGVTRDSNKNEATREFFSDDREVHQKWAQAVASAYGLLTDANYAFYAGARESMAHFIAPVVVVPDGTLWAADYDETGCRIAAASQMEEVEFYLDHSPWRIGQTFSYTFSHIHFVTLTGLVAYIHRLHERNYLNRLFGAATVKHEELTDPLLPSGVDLR